MNIRKKLALFKGRLKRTWRIFKQKCTLNWRTWSLKTLLLASFIYLVSLFSFSFEISFNKKKVLAQNNTELLEATTENTLAATPMNIANPATAIGAGLSAEQQKEAKKYNNLSIVFNENIAQKMGETVFNYKKQVCLNYISKYLAVAKEEANLFNIPVSIKLAQGLLETNAGESSLAQKENNHFGIKCKKKCLGCRCANYADDDKYDMFRVFESPWGSFREHSKLLQQGRYKHLLNLPRSNYKAWAQGLKKAGYATDKKYDDKLIKIIEYFNLQQYDL